jgi:hypothetical protein
VWTNRYDGTGNHVDFATAIAVDNSGRVVVTGSSFGTTAAYDYATIAYSAAGTPLWTNRYDSGFNDSPRAIAVDGSGNVIVTGGSADFLSDNFYTIKYSASGAILWTTRYDAQANGGEEPRAIAVDSAGNAFVAGYSEDAFALKYWTVIAYSNTGVPLWTNRYDGPELTTSQPNAVVVDAGGNVFAAGVVALGDSNTGQDFLTIKYSGSGVPLWTNFYNGSGNGNDGAIAVAADGSGNVIVTGTSPSTEEPSSRGFLTIKYSGDGVPLWTNRYHGPAVVGGSPTDLAVDQSGNVFVTGAQNALNNLTDFATVAYSSAGVPLWTNRYDGAGHSDDYARSVAVDSSGNVFVTGDAWGGVTQDYATIKYSAAGVPLWTNRYHGTSSQNSFVQALAVDSAGNVVVTGGDGGFGSTNGGYCTIKYSNTGVALWTNHYNGPETRFGYNDAGRAVAVDSGGNVIVTGNSYATVPINTFDIATVAYSSAGLPLWTNRYNGPANGEDAMLTKRSLALGPGGSVYVAGLSDGDYSDNTIFDIATVKYAVPGPSLFITRSNASVILSWPVSALNFQMQESASLSLSNGWSAVAAPRSTNNGFISVTVPAIGSGKFFRLSSF